MANRKFSRWLWTINGIGLLLLIIFALGSLAVSAVEHVGMWFRPVHERGLIVDERRDVARELDLSIQHVKYDSPSAIYGSDYYLAQVVVLDKEIPREVREIIESAGDVSLQLIGATINILFFSSDRSDVRPLLERNAYIHQFDFPARRRFQREEPIDRPFIFYEMALEDTNRDGRINEHDARQYFLSDLSGHNLRQITPDTLNLDYYWYSEDFNEIYFEEVIVDDSRRHSPFVLEQRTLYYYNIPEDRFGRFDALQDAFADIQREFGESID